MSAADPGDERPTWWTKRKVPAAPVILALALHSGALAFAFKQQASDRDAADKAIRATASAAFQAVEQASCRNQREFRTFFTDYLASQIGSSVEDIGGFEQLSPQARELALSLAPVVEAGREEDREALLRFKATFRIPTCDE